MPPTLVEIMQQATREASDALEVAADAARRRDVRAFDEAMARNAKALARLRDARERWQAEQNATGPEPGSRSK